ncbi:MAG: class I SAM-dependent methyltransferase [Bacillota bacterium]
MHSQNCRLCGTQSQYINSNKLEEDYYHCPECDLIFMDERDIVSTESEKERYEEHDNNHENEGYVNMFKDFIDRAVEPYFGFSKGAKILEFGCGPGPVLADLLEEKGVKVDRYDPYFFPDESYKNKKYDLITSTEVFEHLFEPAKEIESLLSILKDNGILSIMTHFHKKGQGDFIFEDWWYKWDKTHIAFYSQKTMKWIAEKYNLKILFTGNKKLCVFKK